MARITQKTIADQVGVSTSVVSRALSGRAAEIGILPETVRRIEQAARRLGYVPSAAARQLKGAGMRVLGVVAADMEDPFFGPLLAEIIRTSHARSYALTLAGFDRRQPGEADLRLLLEQDLAGLIVAGSGSAPWLDPFLRRGLCAVRIGSGPARDGLHQIAPDVGGGYAELSAHLRKTGRRIAGFIGADIDIHRARLDLFRSAAERNGIETPARAAVFASADVLAAGVEGARALLNRKDPPPGAWVCSSDAVAFGAIRVLASRGFRVPEDIAVAGFDDLPLARLTSPPLTTLRQPIAGMVAAALDRIADPTQGGAPTLYPVPLIVRESTGGRA